ncbi:hypothetical protein HKBW3S25_00859 [Candidatus Hakubella thermalkaliphila]|uniref:HepT-like domain-containing protein n=3 Tax=Candidatus Hakubella thermalkaliphila TaxID=2754717 RepID=A0A6V8NYU5_9ACTN|nr:hypothetical protein HKBW3S25_00859 [Candidatus Hakubella thermalkaliphila]
MKKEPLAILLGYFTNQTEIMEKILQEVKTTKPSGREKVSHLAYLLHNLYCALEDLFQEIAKTFENRIEDLSKYHRELLKRMQLDVPGIRPRVLSKESYLILDELRGFRHIFRHSYDYELAPDRVKSLKQKILTNWRYIERDLDIFIDFLQEAIKD